MAVAVCAENDCAYFSNCSANLLLGLPGGSMRCQARRARQAWQVPFVSVDRGEYRSKSMTHVR
jgi:hypothetical protein